MLVWKLENTKNLSIVYTPLHESNPSDACIRVSEVSQCEGSSIARYVSKIIN